MLLRSRKCWTIEIYKMTKSQKQYAGQKKLHTQCICTIQCIRKWQKLYIMAEHGFMDSSGLAKIDWEGTWGNFLQWWNISYLYREVWVTWCLHLSKLGKLHTWDWCTILCKKSTFMRNKFCFFLILQKFFVVVSLKNTGLKQVRFI